MAESLMSTLTTFLIDFISEYDKIKRSELFVVMKDLDFRPNLIRLVATGQAIPLRMIISLFV